MELTKEVIEQIESSDAFYVIAVHGKTNFTFMDGKDPDKMKSIHHIVQGMLGNVDEFIKEKKCVNSLLLTLFVRAAIKAFPSLKK